MADKQIPWMRWRVAKWRNAPRVLKMSFAARGAFFELIQAGWECGGMLPNEPDLLWHYAHASTPQEFAAVAPDVLAMFKISEDGQFLLNDTLTEDWEDAEIHMQHVRQVRSEAGKRGNEKRWKNRKIAKPSQPVASESQTVAQDVTGQDITGIDPLRPVNKSEGARSARAGSFHLPDWVPFEAWNGYLEMRRRIKKPATNKAMALAVGTLEKLRDLGNDPKEVLERSIFNSWQGLFELPKDKGTNGKPVSKAEARDSRGKSAVSSGVAAAVDTIFGSQNGVGQEHVPASRADERDGQKLRARVV